MAYVAYERTSGESVIQGVQTHSRHLTTSGSFSPSSIPQLNDVEQMIDETFYQLQAHLAKNGYATSVTNVAALGFLERLNIYGAVIQVELAHPIAGRTGEGNERFQEYKNLWDEGITMLASDALEQLGHTREETLSAFVELGGRSKDRKQVAYDDTDVVQPRFARDFGKNPLIPQSVRGSLL